MQLLEIRVLHKIRRCLPQKKRIRGDQGELGEGALRETLGPHGLKARLFQADLRQTNS